MKYFIIGIKNAFNFKGRASRKEFWWFLLFHQLLLTALQFIPLIITNGYVSDMYALSNIILMAILVIPLISVWVRRMHDIDRSGWWSIVPIVAFVFAFFKGTVGNNRFGSPSPYS